MEKQVNFEAALQRLEAIVANLESGRLTLEESMSQFDEGTKLSRICAQRLNDAQKKVEELMKKSDGTTEWQERPSDAYGASHDNG